MFCGGVCCGIFANSINDTLPDAFEESIDFFDNSNQIDFFLFKGINLLIFDYIVHYAHHRLGFYLNNRRIFNLFIIKSLEAFFSDFFLKFNQYYFYDYFQRVFWQFNHKIRESQEYLSNVSVLKYFYSFKNYLPSYHQPGILEIDGHHLVMLKQMKSLQLPFIDYVYYYKLWVSFLPMMDAVIILMNHPVFVLNGLKMIFSHAVMLYIQLKRMMVNVTEQLQAIIFVLNRDYTQMILKVEHFIYFIMSEIIHLSKVLFDQMPKIIQGFLRQGNNVLLHLIEKGEIFFESIQSIAGFMYLIMSASIVFIYEKGLSIAQLTYEFIKALFVFINQFYTLFSYIVKKCFIPIIIMGYDWGSFILTVAEKILWMQYYLLGKGVSFIYHLTIGFINYIFIPHTVLSFYVWYFIYNLSFNIESILLKKGIDALIDINTMIFTYVICPSGSLLLRIINYLTHFILDHDYWSAWEGIDFEYSIMDFINPLFLSFKNSVFSIYQKNILNATVKGMLTTWVLIYAEKLSLNPIALYTQKKLMIAVSKIFSDLFFKPEEEAVM